jgi:hypothetical protein
MGRVSSSAFTALNVVIHRSSLLKGLDGNKWAQLPTS